MIENSTTMAVDSVEAGPEESGVPQINFPYTPGQNAIDVSPDQSGGVLKEILKVGGEDGPLQGDIVTVHYVGVLADDGSKFDSSRDRQEKFEFSLGKGEVIKAWDLGVASMKRNEICRLTCKSEFAYGSAGSPPKIPPNSTLIFEIELFGWRGEDLSSKKDGGIIRRNIVKGDGYQTPNDGAIVDVHLIGRVNGEVVDNREVSFPLGEGMEYGIPEGLERALEKFKRNEKSYIRLTPKYAFGSGGSPEKGIPGGVPIEYELHLRNFEKAKESWEMDQEEKIDQAKLYKEKGTMYFKQDKFRLAIKQYKKIVDLLQYDSGLDDVKKAESHNVLLAGHLNLSMSFLKLKDNPHAKEYATRAIELDKNNVKALFRRGQALLNMGDADLARQDFLKCHKLDPDNKAVNKQLSLCAAMIREQRTKEKKIYCGMFDKFARIDKRKEEEEKRRNGDVMSGELGEWGQNEYDDEGNQVEIKMDSANINSGVFEITQP
ncbi:FK506-binding protein 59kD isoform X2 [Oratosquilla oratoria]|uniref:FK506-binding protein 59kD isoform X2 n=1 Tax=Oratosquilla oratoria TaxID=337810 RepID=UPI003F76BDCF